MTRGRNTQRLNQAASLLRVPLSGFSTGLILTVATASTDGADRRDPQTLKSPGTFSVFGRNKGGIVSKPKPVACSKVLENYALAPAGVEDEGGEDVREKRGEN